MSARTVASQSSASRLEANVTGAVCRSSRGSVNLAWNRPLGSRRTLPNDVRVDFLALLVVPVTGCLLAVRRPRPSPPAPLRSNRRLEALGTLGHETGRE